MSQDKHYSETFQTINSESKRNEDKFCSHIFHCKKEFLKLALKLDVRKIPQHLIHNKGNNSNPGWQGGG